MKIFLRRLSYLLIAALLVWVVAIQAGCFPMRTPDIEWGQKLREKSQSQAPYFLNVTASPDRNVHAVGLGQQSELPLVVLVHGSPGSADAYLDYLADTVLSAAARLVAIDRPGFGYSSFGRPETSLAEQALCVKKVVDQLSPNRPVVLVGHSMGGPVIARFAMDYPQQTAGLVIVAGSIDPTLEPHQWWVPVVDAPPIRWLIPKPLWLSNHEIRPLSGELEQMLPLWAQIHCPVTVVHAHNDRLVPFGNAAFARKMLTQSADFQLVEFETGNHFILWSRQAEVRQVILEMLGGVSVE